MEPTRFRYPPIVIALALVIFASPSARAEEPALGPLRLSLERAAAAQTLQPVFVQQSAAVTRQSGTSRSSRSTGRKIAGGVVGAVGGFFCGGFLGAAIEGDRCDCDDPGFLGFLIGAPIGAAVGGILGAKLLF